MIAPGGVVCSRFQAGGGVLGSHGEALGSVRKQREQEETVVKSLCWGLGGRKQ